MNNNIICQHYYFNKNRNREQSILQNVSLEFNLSLSFVNFFTACQYFNTVFTHSTGFGLQIKAVMQVGEIKGGTLVECVFTVFTWRSLRHINVHSNNIIVVIIIFKMAI